MLLIIYILILFLLFLNRLYYKRILKDKGEENIPNFIKLINDVAIYLVIIIVIVAIRTYIVTPVRVDGESMVPTLSNNEILILQKYDDNYKRFDIVVLNYNNQKLIKRVIGLPGEYVKYKNNNLYINGVKIEEQFNTGGDTEDFELKDLGNYKKIPVNYYLVLGDNRENSVDSRIIGLINKKSIVGKTKVSIYPFSKIGKINKNK